MRRCHKSQRKITINHKQCSVALKPYDIAIYDGLYKLCFPETAGLIKYGTNGLYKVYCNGYSDQTAEGASAAEVIRRASLGEVDGRPRAFCCFRSAVSEASV